MQQKIRCTELCHPAHSCVNISTTCSDTIDLTHCVERRGPAQSDLDVPTRSQLQILTSNAWLDDSLMDLGQKLLSQQYPHISGFQLVVLSEKFAFVPQPDEFIQILNLNNNHWILISTIGCPAATVNVYDSLHGTLPSRAQRLVADILQCQSTHITVRYPDTQWQSNSHDCGLFTLANATALCAGLDPCTLSFEHAKMRDHYLNCIRAGILLPFPLRSKRRRINRPQLQRVPIFCICRLPDDGTQMVQCHKCEDWFHTKCVRVPKACLMKENQTWSCPSCRQTLR